jgi:hypothetical protein
MAKISQPIAEMPQQFADVVDAVRDDYSHFCSTPTEQSGLALRRSEAMFLLHPT